MKKEKIKVLKAYREILLEVKKEKINEELIKQEQNNTLEFKPKIKILSLFK